MKFIKRYGIISLGCVIFALGFALFLKPAEIAPGGVSGVAILISHFYPSIDSGIVILMLNIPLLISGAIILGGKFFVGTIWATFFSSVCISFFERILNNTLTDDIFCASLLGALFLGIGLGLVFRENATTGGTDIAVRLIQKRLPHMKSGNIFLIIDSVVVIMSGVIHGDIRTATYSGLSLGLSMFVFNYVLYGGMRAKLLIIIDDNVSSLPYKLMHETGVTIIDARGAYSGEKKNIMICAVDKRKYPLVTRMIANSAPDAIVITTPAEGFSHGRSIV